MLHEVLWTFRKEGVSSLCHRRLLGCLPSAVSQCRVDALSDSRGGWYKQLLLMIKQLSLVIPTLLLAVKQSAPMRACRAVGLSPALWPRAFCAGSLHLQATSDLPAASMDKGPQACLQPPPISHPDTACSLH